MLIPERKVRGFIDNDENMSEINVVPRLIATKICRVACQTQACDRNIRLHLGHTCWQRHLVSTHGWGSVTGVIRRC